jgi:hypothetical protein
LQIALWSEDPCIYSKTCDTCMQNEDNYACPNYFSNNLHCEIKAPLTWEHFGSVPREFLSSSSWLGDQLPCIEVFLISQVSLYHHNVLLLCVCLFFSLTWPHTCEDVLDITSLQFLALLLISTFFTVIILNPN